MFRVSVLIALALLTLPVSSKPGDVVALSTDRLAGVWFVPERESETVSVKLVVLAGEFDATGPEGIAHYTEHLVAEHLRHVNSGTVPLRSNAWTSERRTVYWAQGASEELDALIGRVARALKPLFVPAPFAETERDVVLREYALRYGENWQARLNNASFRELHAGTAMARQVIGTPDSISKFDLAMAARFQAAHYTADNAVLLVQGAVKPRDIKRAVDRHFNEADVPGLAPRRVVSLGERRDRIERRIQEDKAAGNSVWWLRSALLDSDVDAPQMAVQLHMLERLLVSRLPGSLARDLRYKRFVLSRFGLHWTVYSGQYFTFGIELVPDNGVSSNEALTQTRAALETLRREGVPRDSLKRLKTREYERLDSQDPVNLVAQRAESLLEMGYAPESVAALRKRVRRVTVSDLKRLLDALSEARREVIYAITPDQEH